MVSSVLHILGAAPYDVDGVDLQLMCSQRNPVCSATRALTIPGMYPRTVNRMLMKTVACAEVLADANPKRLLKFRHTVSSTSTLEEDSERRAMQTLRCQYCVMADAVCVY